MREGYKKTEIGVIPLDWEVVELGEKSVLMTNGFVGTATSFYTEESDGVIYIQGFNVQENSFRLTNIKKITKEFNQKNKKSILKEGDLLTVQTGHIGTTVVVSEDLESSNCHALIITRLEKNECDPYFISYYINSEYGKKQVKTIQVGTTLLHINLKDYLKYKIPLPPLTQQKKIAKILSTVDEKIEAITLQIEKSEIVKKGLMQRLLNDEFWEIKTLDSIATITMGQSPKSSTYNQEKIGIPLIQGNADCKNRRTVPRTYTTELTKECFVGDIIMTVRAPVGAISKSLHNACIGRGVCSIKPNEENEFLYHFLVNYEDKWDKLSQGSTFTAVSGSDIRSIKLFFPPLKEQTKIANILTTADKKLEVLRAKKAKYEELKVGLMQKLLTGEVRV